MTAKPLGVGLLGLGTVGSAVARAFAERSRRLDASAGRPLQLVAAAVRDPRKQRDAGDVPLTVDPFAILDDPEIGVVIEVIGGMEPARDLLDAAFERGKHVVTANKELVAREWNALHEAARLAKRELRYEATVGAAIPVIAGVRALGAVRPRVLRGLLNGTSTYILGRIEQGASFEEALVEAQQKGYAEADPSNDVDGWDAAYKLSILISILEGRWFDPEQVRRTSLRGVSATEVRSARERGAIVRYVATADFGERAVKARVAPEELPGPLAAVVASASGPENVIELETDMAAPRLLFAGPGAGGDATASAILGDVIAIARRS